MPPILSGQPDALLLLLLLGLPVVVLLIVLVRRRPRGATASLPATGSAGAAAVPPLPPHAAEAVAMIAAAAGAAPTPAAEPTAAERVAVLVVDDSAVVRAKLKRLLEGAGHRVVLASDGFEALAALAATPFALLITDLEMPNMNGFELIAAVQGSLESEDLPIIAITGHEQLQARVHDCQGLYGLFKKPWSDRRLLERVAALTAMKRHSRPLAMPA